MICTNLFQVTHDPNSSLFHSLHSPYILMTFIADFQSFRCVSKPVVFCPAPILHLINSPSIVEWTWVTERGTRRCEGIPKSYAYFNYLCLIFISLHFCFNCQIHRQLFNSNLRQLASEHLHIRVSVQFICYGVPYGQKYSMWWYNVYVLFLWSTGSTEHHLWLFRKGQSNDILLTAPWLLLIE